MRAVIQRVSGSSVAVDGKIVGSIGKGLTVLLGVGEGDDENDAAYLSEKIAGLRIFEDDEGKMNLSLSETEGSVLAISQFTLYGDTRKGRRPSFIRAAAPERANELYRQFCENLKNLGVTVEEGIFQADMLVRIDNDGPVTILIDSRKEF